MPNDGSASSNTPWPLPKFRFEVKRDDRVKSDHKFWDWFNGVKMNAIGRKPVAISLLDEAGAPT